MFEKRFISENQLGYFIKNQTNDFGTFINQSLNTSQDVCRNCRDMSLHSIEQPSIHTIDLHSPRLLSDIDWKETNSICSTRTSSVPQYQEPSFDYSINQNVNNVTEDHEFEDELTKCIGDPFGDLNAFLDPSSFVNPHLFHEIFNHSIWILHFWSFSNTNARQALKQLAEIPTREDTIIITIQLDSNVPHSWLTRLPIDYHRIVVLNDVNHYFNDIYHYFFHHPSPSFVLIVNQVIKDMGYSFGHSNFIAFPELDNLYDFEQPGWKSPLLGTVVPLQELFPQNETVYLDPRLQYRHPNGVVMIHIWSHYSEACIQCWPLWNALQAHFPQFTHIAVHVDTAFEVTYPEDIHLPSTNIISIVDVSGRFKTYWFKGGYTRVPCTMLINQGILEYMNDSKYFLIK
jgi:hypothetical protein